jgi:UPF0755 protein
MSRHSAPGTDGAYGDETWLPGGSSAEPADGATGRRRQPARHAADPQYQPGDSAPDPLGPDSPTGPPWEQPDWDDTGSSLPGPDPAGLAGKHPSDPLPSLPPPPLREGDWAEAPQALEYAGETGHHPGYHGPVYPGDAGDTDGGYAGDRLDDTGYGYEGYDDTGYDHGGYPGAGYPAGYDDTGTGFPVTNGGFPAVAGDFTDTGTGYAVPAYADGRFTDGTDRYPDDGDYPAGDEYLPYDEHSAGPDDRGYPDREGWYEDTGVHSGWAEGDDSGFLPGMSSGTQDETDARPGEGRTDGRGGRRGSTGPGKQSAGRSGSGRPGPGRPGKSGTSGGGKRKSGIRRWAPWLALSVVVALLLGAGAGYFYVYRTYLHPPDFAGPGTTVRVVRIYPGDTAGAVGQRLQQDGVVASARAFSNAAKASGQGSSLEPGYYRVRLHMSAALAFALLLKPSSREQTRVVIPEGWRLSQIIAALGRDTGELQGYQQAIKNKVAALNLPSFAKGKPEGYLFPATYDVQPNTPPLKVLQQMVTRFDAEAAALHLPAAAAHAELTQADVITVASLIQAEGKHLADFPKIARVIYNRLNSSPQIPLQLDSTVIYALYTHGIRATDQQVAQHLKVKSSYNTFLHTGLPPGPIDSPGDAAIKAALHPAHGSWMYFVTVDPKTGLTKFTSSFAQFQRYEAELTANIAKGQ